MIEIGQRPRAAQSGACLADPRLGPYPPRCAGDGVGCQVLEPCRSHKIGAVAARHVGAERQVAAQCPDEHRSGRHRTRSDPLRRVRRCIEADNGRVAERDRVDIGVVEASGSAACHHADIVGGRREQHAAAGRACEQRARGDAGANRLRDVAGTQQTKLRRAHRCAERDVAAATVLQRERRRHGQRPDHVDVAGLRVAADHDRSGRDARQFVGTDREAIGRRATQRDRVGDAIAGVARNIDAARSQVEHAAGIDGAANSQCIGRAAARGAQHHVAAARHARGRDRNAHACRPLNQDTGIRDLRFTSDIDVARAERRDVASIDDANTVANWRVGRLRGAQAVHGDVAADALHAGAIDLDAVTRRRSTAARQRAADTGDPYRAAGGRDATGRAVGVGDQLHARANGTADARQGDVTRRTLDGRTREADDRWRQEEVSPGVACANELHRTPCVGIALPHAGVDLCIGQAHTAGVEQARAGHQYAAAVGGDLAVVVHVAAHATKPGTEHHVERAAGRLNGGRVEGRDARVGVDLELYRRACAGALDDRVDAEGHVADRGRRQRAGGDRHAGVVVEREVDVTVLHRRCNERNERVGGQRPCRIAVGDGHIDRIDHPASRPTGGCRAVHSNPLQLQRRGRRFDASTIAARRAAPRRHGAVRIERLVADDVDATGIADGRRGARIEHDRTADHHDAAGVDASD